MRSVPGILKGCERLAGVERNATLPNSVRQTDAASVFKPDHSVQTGGDRAEHDPNFPSLGGLDGVSFALQTDEGQNAAAGRRSWD